MRDKMRMQLGLRERGRVSTDGVDQTVRQLTSLRTIHIQVPHPLDDRILRPERLRERIRREGNSEHEQGEREGTRLPMNRRG